MKHYIHNNRYEDKIESEKENRVTSNQLNDFWHRMDIRFKLTKERVRQLRAKQNASGQYNN